jgi:hypothetical protein
MPPPEPVGTPSEDRPVTPNAPAGPGGNADGSFDHVNALLEVYGPMSKRQMRWFAIKVLLRALGIAALVLVGYFLLPVSVDGEASGLVVLILGLTVLVIVIIGELRRILAADHPAVRAIEAVAIVVPLFIVVFAYSYVWMSTYDPASFNQPIDRVDGIYFTVTVLSTVGFGDIAANTQNARIVVTIQMVLDLVLIGVVAKLIVGAGRLGLQRQRGEVTATGTAAMGGATPTGPTTSGPPEPGPTA